MSFELPQLPYAYDDLDPTLTQKQWKFTMENTMVGILQN